MGSDRPVHRVTWPGDDGPERARWWERGRAAGLRTRGRAEARVSVEPVLAGFMVCTDMGSGLGGVEESRHREDG